ncbi:MAG: GreA/GreB family elongation factor [Verrucomicrobiota bacterium]|nr:GreA/GreB family elongation factor [Verrucomicrobiota bacterium]
MSELDSQNDLENKVLSVLEQGTASAAEWIAVLEEGRRAGRSAVFREWAAWAQEALAKKGNVEEGLDLLKWRAENTPIEQMTGKDWVKAADVVAGSNPHMLALIQEAGFGQRLAARECVRRFRLLHRMQAGVLCLHRTWGFGVVQKADSLYKKIEINFRGRPGHGLAMKAAAETLEILEREHVLARLHEDPEALQQLVSEAPAEVVKLALASFGPLTASALQEKLVQYGVVAAGDWKRFWDAARKILKADPMVEVPTKRNEPLRLLDRASGYDEAWYDRLANERSIKTILSRIREFLDGNPDVKAIAPVQRRILANRLSFVLLGATSRQPGLKWMGAMLAARLGLSAAECDWPAAVREFLQGNHIVELLRDLPARELKPSLDFLFAQDEAAARATLLQHLTHLNFTALQEGMEQLVQHGASEDTREIYARACAGRHVREEMLLWMLRHPEQCEAWDLPNPTQVAPMVVSELEQEYMGDRLKTQKLLREKFEEPTFLQAVFNGMTSGRQMDFFRQLNQSSAWSGLDRQTLQAKIIKLFPKLQVVITGNVESAPVASYGAVTSQRTYRERQEQLEKLINIDIPANSREIAVARSYGDLRENFEYKAAKEMQGVLMARRADLEVMLSSVRPSDFSETPVGVAGVGSSVLLAYPDAREERFHILGEWDQVPEKNIISSSTRLARAVAGRKIGEKVLLPTEEGGEVEAELKAVEPLPDDIKEWVKAP